MYLRVQLKQMVNWNTNVFLRLVIMYLNKIHSSVVGGKHENY